MKEDKFITSTIGLWASHKKLKYSTLIRIQFYETKDGDIRLVAISGKDLSRFKQIPTQTISKEEWYDAPNNPYNDIEEWDWAADILGVFRGEGDDDDDEFDY